MKEQKRRKWELIGLFFTIAAGNLLHFVYDWSGESPLAAPFAAVSESVWEHMKLLAVPWVLWTVVELWALRCCRLLAARTVGLLAGLALIPLVYYAYTGALGVHSLLLDVILFQLAVLLTFSVCCRLQRKRKLTGTAAQIVSGAVLLVLTVLFVWWSFAPPALPIFGNPAA